MTSDLLRNDQKTYVLGLLIAAGTIDERSFIINIPLNKWGIDPNQQAEISRNILTKIRRRFSDSYGISIDYEIGNNNSWRLFPLAHSETKIDLIKEDLQILGLPQVGILLSSTDLTSVSTLLTGSALEHFLVGIFDARASLTDSHRRFVDSAPIVSIEVPGKSMNFRFVIQLCALLTRMGSTTDQILFNHPNFHSSKDPDYKSWKKGFKIRLLAASFIDRYSFALSAKKIDAEELAGHQTAKAQTPCISRSISAGSRTIHADQFDPTLPTEVRGKVFLHYHQVCAAMGCPYAPVANVKEMVKTAKNHISIWPLCTKGEIDEISKKFEQIRIQYFPGASTKSSSITVAKSLGIFTVDDYSESTGALAFLVAPSLNGKRPRGNMDLIISGSSSKLVTVIEIDGCAQEDKPPVLMINHELNRAVIISSITGKSNRKLIENDLIISGIEISLRHRNAP